MKTSLTSFLAFLILAIQGINAQNTQQQGFNFQASSVSYASDYTSSNSGGGASIFTNTFLYPSYTEGEVMDKEAAKSEISKSIEVNTNSSVAITAKEFFADKNLAVLTVPEPVTETETVATASNYYAIERSADTYSYSQIGVAVAAGNTVAEHDYTFIDSSINEYISYYRLRNMDDEDAGDIGNLKWIRVFGGNEIILYPNKANDVLNIKLNDEVLHKIVVTGTDGREYMPPVNIGQNGIAKLDISSLPDGIYFITLSNMCSIDVVRFFKTILPINKSI